MNTERLFYHRSKICEYCGQELIGGKERCEKCGAPSMSKDDKIAEAYKEGFSDAVYAYKIPSKKRMKKEGDTSDLLGLFIMLVTAIVTFFACYGIFHFVTGF